MDDRNNKKALRTFLSKVAYDESILLQDKLLKEKELSYNDKFNILKKRDSLREIETYCLYVPSLDNYEFESYISNIGIANVCSFFGNFCSQYYWLTPANYSISKATNSYTIELDGEKIEVPITTQAGHPNEHFHHDIGIFGSEYNFGENEYNIIYNNFKEAANIISEYIDKCNDYELSNNENMNANKVRSSLHSLVDKGMNLINAAISENISLNQNSSENTDELSSGKVI